MVWQLSHREAVGIWLAGFASALTAVKLPLWHVEQLPVAIGPVVPAWLMTAGLNTVVLVWQVSHCAAVGI